MNEDLRQKALSLEVAKRYGEAADLYQQIGLGDKAAYLFQKAGRIEEAVEVFMAENRLNKAGQVYEKAGQPAKAASCYERGKDFASAGKMYQKMGDFIKAGTAYEKGELWKESAKAFQKAKQYARAGALFKKAGDEIGAARAWAALSEDESSAPTGPQALKAAASALEEAGRFVKAAEMYLKSDLPLSALTCYLKGNAVSKAAECYMEKCREKSYELISHVPREGKLYKNYAAMFILAMEFPMAAQVYENFGECIKAAEMYEQIGDTLLAAEAFLKGEDKERAAMMYAQGGDWERAAGLFAEAENDEWAAENYERAENFYEAGRHYIRCNLLDKSITALQKVDEGRMHYFEASGLLCQAYIKKGLKDLALTRYEKIVADSPLSPETMDLYYDMSLLLIQEKHHERAEKILTQILGLRFDYKDTEKLLKELKKTESHAPVPPAVPVKQAIEPSPPPAPKSEKKHQKETPPPTAPPAVKPPPPPEVPKKPVDSKHLFGSWLHSIKKKK